MHQSTFPPTVYKVKVKSESHSVMSKSLHPHGLDSPWDSLGQNSGVDSLSLLQGIFPTQGSNPGLPHCKQILYQLSHQVHNLYQQILYQVLFTPHPHTYLCSFWWYTILTSVRWYLIVVLTYISLMIIDVDHLACACWPSAFLFWRNVCLGLLPIFKSGCFVLLLLNCMRCLYSLDINPLLVI